MPKNLDMLLDIASEKNGFRIGDPWRFSEFSLAAIVPILRSTEDARAYRLISEADKDVLIKDTGSIDRMSINNRGDTPVLVKAGDTVAGATQTRVFVLSQVIMAGESIDADCVCVHASKGIRAGQKVKVSEYSPVSVRSAVYRGYHTEQEGFGPRFVYDSSLQSNVWGSVRDYSRGLQAATLSYAAAAHSGNLGDLGSSPIPSPQTWHSPSEDLAGRVSESKEKFEAVLNKVPKFDNQVGICLLTVEGLELLESFEHSASWDALRQSILKAESGKIGDVTDQDAVFEFKPEKAKAAVRALLTAKYEDSVVNEKQDTMTLVLRGEKFVGEVVTLYGKPIHCTFAKAA